MTATPADALAPAWPPGPGEMAGLVRAHDWAATPLGPLAGWPDRLKVAVEMTLASPLVSSLVCGPDRVLLYNDAAARLYGDRHPAALGRPLPETFPEGWAAVAPFYGQAFAGEAVQVAGQPVDTRGEGEATEVFDAYLIPVRAPDGAVACVHMTGFEVGGRLAAAAALRESEERFGQFAKASSDALWIRDAATLSMEFVSPAIEAIYGVPPGEVEGGIERWADLILAEDRDAALAHIERARGGHAALHEFRIRRRSDGAIRWIRNTDFPLLDANGRVQRIGGIARDVTEAKEAVERQGMLLAELQHRVRNTLAVLRSIARRTAASSETVEDYALELDGRLNAFARVQAAVTRNPLAGIDLEYLIADELMIHAAREGEQVRIQGPPIRLAAKVAETLGLAIHELATNAVKHGALATPRGRIRVTWRRQGDAGAERLHLVWKESGVPPAGRPPGRRGFGTDLLVRTVAYELKAEARHEIEPDGLRYTLDLPLAGKVVAGHGAALAAGARASLPPR